MCGIAGIFNSELRPEDLGTALAAMERCLRHRGPDEGSVRILPECAGGLAVRRLSIVDVEHGQQPVVNEDGTILAVLNGEIYNHQELRKALRSHGHRLRTESDTEVLVHLYEHHGTECLERLSGMFALAIFDTRERRILLARDRAGMKPLYWAQVRRGFVFASEAKALFASGMIRPEPDLESLDSYLALGYIPAAATAFRRVRKLAAGEYMMVEATGARSGRFWEYRYPDVTAMSDEETYAGELEALLSSAVGSHLQGDVPVGAFVSGGWDSSLVASMAAEKSGKRLKTFSIVFPEDPGSDESRFSRLIAQSLGSEHYEIEYRNSLLPALMPKIARHLDEPCSNVPVAVGFVLASLAGAHVKTVLSGEGADELFGGYDWLRTSYPYALRRWVPRWPARLAARYFGPSRLRTGLRFLGAPDTQTADAEWGRGFTPEDKQQVMLPEFRAAGPDVEPALVRPEILATCKDDLARRLAFEFKGRLADAILFAHDKMSMAHSLEVRMPFLDTAVVDFALRLPSRMKIRDGREKVVLGCVARRRLPAEIAARRKKGLAYPDGFWSRPPCEGYARELLLDGSRKSLLDRKYLERNLPKWLAGGKKGTALITRLVFLENWWNEMIASADARAV